MLPPVRTVNNFEQPYTLWLSLRVTKGKRKCSTLAAVSMSKGCFMRIALTCGSAVQDQQMPPQLLLQLPPQRSQQTLDNSSPVCNILLSTVERWEDVNNCL